MEFQLYTVTSYRIDSLLYKIVEDIDITVDCRVIKGTIDQSIDQWWKKS